jgi:hypothetical protein
MAWSLWLPWAVLFATLAIWIELPRLAPWPEPWNAAETAVAGFVLAILALVAGIGTFALRESLVQRRAGEGGLDPATDDGFTRLRFRLVGLWLLCAAIGVLGGIMIRHSGGLAAGLPYLVGAAALFVVHAPTPRFLHRLCSGGEPRSKPV